MKILDTTNKLILTSSSTQNKTYLLHNPTLSIISTYPNYYRIGSLQYSTCIAALGTSSQVHFYGMLYIMIYIDFKYNRKISQI